MRLRAYLRKILFAALVILPASAQAATVDAIRVGVHPDKTRLVIQLSETSAFRAFTMEAPYRLAIDLPTFGWGAGKPVLPPGTVISNIRQGRLDNQTSRIIVDLARPVAIQAAFVMPPSTDDGSRLVVDFTTVAPAAFAQKSGKVFGNMKSGNVRGVKAEAVKQERAPSDAVPAESDRDAAPLPKAKPTKEDLAPKLLGTYQVHNGTTYVTPKPRLPADEQPLEQAPDIQSRDEPSKTTAPTRQERDVAPEPTPAPASVDGGDPLAGRGDSPVQRPAKANGPGGDKPLIVIDPGHGGIDPGSLGVGGLFEKNVTIGMGLELKKELEATGRYRVLMTRDGDTFLPLQQRVAVARTHHANLFVSLHADSISRNNVQGASIYTLSDKASDAQTAKLAARENRADAIGGLNINNEDDQVANILVDLVMRDNMNQSKFFANTMVANMKRNGIRLLENTQRSAGFAVLKAPDIPSVLIEMGFMTNARESALLMSEDYRGKLAQALVSGIDAYFKTIGKTNRL